MRGFLVALGASVEGIFGDALNGFPRVGTGFTGVFVGRHGVIQHGPKKPLGVRRAVRGRAQAVSRAASRVGDPREARNATGPSILLPTRSEGLAGHGQSA